jgi:hypothetical protein
MNNPQYRFLMSSAGTVYEEGEAPFEASPLPEAILAVDCQFTRAGKPTFG